MSLIGVVRHLTEVEAYWLRVVLHGHDVATFEQELARHLGHLDLLREAVDGRTGY